MTTPLLLLKMLGPLLLGLFLGRIVTFVVFRAIGSWARKTSTIIDDAVARHLRSPLRWLFPFIGLQLSLPFALIPVGAKGVVAQTALAITVATAGWALSALSAVVEESVVAGLEHDHLTPAQLRSAKTRARGFRNVASFAVTILTIAFMLMSFDRVRQIGAGLLASAGIAGVVLGFAAQKTLGTLLAGLQVTITQPIKVGDVVIVEGEWGTIEEMSITYVVVKIWDLRRLVVPITYFIDKPVQNWTRGSADLLGTINLPLDYAVPLAPLRAELKRVCEASPHWDRVACGIQVTDANEKTMLVRPLVSAKDAGALWELRCEVREALITFVNDNYPGALPRLRVDTSPASVHDLDDGAATIRKAEEPLAS